MKPGEHKFGPILKKNLPVIVLALVLILPYLLFRGFLLRFLALAALPLIYVYLRIRSRIKSNKWRLWFTLLYLFLVTAAPVTEMLLHTSGLPDLTLLLLLGYYTPPFLLYLLLTVLLFDLLLGLNRLFKLVPGRVTAGKGFRRWSLGLLFFIPLAVVVIGIINFNTLRVNYYTIEIPKQSSNLTRLRIAVASDFHLSSQTLPGFMENFATRIKPVSPDIVLLPGDILEGDRHDLNLKPFEAQFRRIQTRYGVFASPGNHEFHGRHRSAEFFSNSNIRMLEDEWVLIPDSFYIVGRNDKRRRSRKSLAELLKGMSEDLPVILLDHRPVDFDKVSRSRVSLQVSGHTHHGQLFPLNLISELNHELSWGHLQKRNTHFFVTCGIQLWGPRVRTAGVSEIMVIDVIFRE